jgi:hypothetical protein
MDTIQQERRFGPRRSLCPQGEQSGEVRDQLRRLCDGASSVNVTPAASSSWEHFAVCGDLPALCSANRRFKAEVSQI